MKQEIERSRTAGKHPRSDTIYVYAEHSTFPWIIDAGRSNLLNARTMPLNSPSENYSEVLADYRTAW